MKKNGRRKAQSKSGIKGKRFNQEGRDSITGLSFQIDNYGIIQSDEVYGPESEFVRRINADLGLPIQGDLWFEVELGKDKIIFTTKFIGNTDSFINESYQRSTITGQFEYKNGILSKATLDGISGYAVDFKDGNTYYESSYIGKFTQPREVYFPSSVPLWEYATREEGTELVFFAQKSNDLNVEEGNVLGIIGYLGGRIYEDEFWKNPFEPNLI